MSDEKLTVKGVVLEKLLDADVGEIAFLLAILTVLSIIPIVLLAAALDGPAPQCTQEASK